MCYELVAAESFLGASSLGRSRGLLVHTHALDLADTHVAAVLYILIYIYIYILLLRQVYICVCALKNHLFLTVISITMTSSL